MRSGYPAGPRSPGCTAPSRRCARRSRSPTTAPPGRTGALRMTPRDRLLHLTSDDALHDGLIELAGSSAPDYRDDILQRVARTRQRPRRTFIERWLPMSLITARSSTAPPLRAAWMLLLDRPPHRGPRDQSRHRRLLLLRDRGPDGLNGGLMVPTLALDATWDSTTIPGLSVPAGMDVGPDGDLYIVSAGSNEIIVVDPAGNVVRRWGEEGSGDGQFLFHRLRPTRSTGSGAWPSHGTAPSTWPTWSTTASSSSRRRAHSYGRLAATELTMASSSSRSMSRSGPMARSTSWTTSGTTSSASRADGSGSRRSDATARLTARWTTPAGSTSILPARS